MPTCQIKEDGCVRTQGRLLSDIPQWCIGYFKLKRPEKQQEQEELSDSPLSPYERKPYHRSSKMQQCLPQA